jgi:hypothetical protein
MVGMAMFWKKRKKDIHQLIFDIAEYSRDSDRRDLYTRLAELELYALAVSANFGAMDGEKLVVGDGMRIEIPTMEIQGYQLAVFFIEKTDRRLGPRFIGMSVAEAFAMVEKSNLGGIVFYNNQDSYFGIPRETIPSLRKEFLQA